MIDCTTIAQQAISGGYIGIPYSTMDCQAFVERVLKDAGGGAHDWLGSNDMWRNALSIKGTLEEMSEHMGGDIIPGMWVFKSRAPGEAKYDLPSRYKKGGAKYDGDLNDYYHVGIYVGCGVVMHSTTGGVQKGNLSDGWTLAGLCMHTQIPGGAHPDGDITGDVTGYDKSEAIAQAIAYINTALAALADANEKLKEVTNNA